MSKTMREQLAPLAKQNWKPAELPVNPNGWIKDGLDHINISRASKIQLGKALNLDYSRDWEHEILGPFRSLNSLWFFVRAEKHNDAIRSMIGNELRFFVDRECGGFGEDVPNFRNIILDSMYRRVLKNNDICRDLRNSTLPFDSYRENQVGVRIRFENIRWVVMGYEEIRQALKEERKPDFSWITGQNFEDELELYNPFLKKIIREVSEEEIESLAKEKQEKEIRERKAAKRERIKQRKAQERKDREAQKDLSSQIQDIDGVVPPDEIIETEDDEIDIAQKDDADSSVEKVPTETNEVAVEDKVVE